MSLSEPGALALLAVGSRRRPENRLFILGMSSIALMALNTQGFRLPQRFGASA
jgi:hypothetical protein